MSKDVLIISGIPGAENCARMLAEQLSTRVETTDREHSLALLRHDYFGVIVVEENLIEVDSAWADELWLAMGVAVPLQVNFAITGCARLSREVRAALQRLDGEQAVALRAATEQIENELRSSVTGLLLESELALREPQMSPALAARVRHLVQLAGAIRERLRCAA